MSRRGLKETGNGAEPTMTGLYTRAGNLTFSDGPMPLREGLLEGIEEAARYLAMTGPSDRH